MAYTQCCHSMIFSWRPTYQLGCVFSPTFPYQTNYKLQCSTFCAAPVCRSRVTRRVLSGAKDHGDFLKGGVKTFTSTPPPPWTLSAWRHPPSGKLKNAPTLEHSQAPPLGHCPCDVIHIRASHYILWRSVVTLRHLLSSAARVGKNPVMVASELFFLALIGNTEYI